MKTTNIVLRSRLARRIFILFIICAIAPMTIFALISFMQVNRQIEANIKENLRSQASSLGTLIIDRIVLVDMEMEMLVKNLDEDFSLQWDIDERSRNESLHRHYLWLSLVSKDGKPVRELLGQNPGLPRLDKDQMEDVLSGQTLLFTEPDENMPVPVYVCKRALIPGGSSFILLARIRPEYLIGLNRAEIELEKVKICIVEGNRVLYSSLPPEYHDNLLNSMPSGPIGSGIFDWSHGGLTFMAGSSQVFIKTRYSGPTCTIILSMPKEYIMGPMALYRNTYVLVFFIAVLIVMLLSINQIRKSLIPLDRLQKGTGNISRGNFSSRVAIKSNDEFGMLAESFNTMAERLDHQFKTLKTMAGIDRAILSVLDTEKIVDTVLSRASDVLPCDCVCTCLFDRKTDTRWDCYTKDINHPGKKIARTMELTGGELAQLYQNRNHMIVNHDQALPVYLDDMAAQSMSSFLVMPIIIGERISAIIALGNTALQHYSKDVLLQARQIVDRIAVALSNTNLMEDLNMLNWGTLQTLARVVDAKSHWTAGHSERVADIAVKIGIAMGLSVREAETLKKTGLLHDIGKIATPRALLDKPGRLTNEEFGIIQEHPGNGARILEPITPYREIIPGVLQHHERFDGKGYPDGISGREIALHARILAVADTFDAMISNRPYREGMRFASVVRTIKQEAGHQFDPEVVDAFLSIINEEALVEVCA
ncbi:MAG: HD domain-containing protein [Deltaproteobacteria bacterium]|nr:HD domain-containing protein [Deltaproteobacteria bacterium]